MPVQLWTYTPTAGDDFLLGGGGTDTIDGGDGDDLILGDSTTPFATGTTLSEASPANIDNAARWTTEENPLIADASVPHTSLFVTTNPAHKNYSSVTVGAGETITVDIDFGNSAIGVFTDTMIKLLDSGSNVVASDDDFYGNAELGSPSGLDSFLTYTNNTGSSQVYTIVFQEFGDDNNFEGNENFVANISVTGHDATATLVPGNDVLTGGIGDDLLAGQGGNDTLSGGDGYDDLSGGSGDDVLDGGNGFDTAWYNDATSAVTVDLRITTAQNTGGAGSDTLTNIEYVTGSRYGDTLKGTDFFNYIHGGAGNDTIYGYGGPDSLYGEDGNDTIYGGDGDDGLYAETNLYTAGASNTLIGGIGNDYLASGYSDDTLEGDSGNDTFYDTGGNDIIAGASGTDELEYWGISSGVTVDLTVTTAQNTGTAGMDTITGIENLIGSGGNDTLTGTGGINWIRGVYGNDVINGGGGGDLLNGGDGDDTIDGGVGNDTATYIDTTNNVDSVGVTVGLYTTSAQDTVHAGMDTLIGIENLIGSNFDDTLTGNAAGNILDGGNGNDNLSGRSGDDRLTGGDGDDTLNGGAGDDVLSGGPGTDTASYAGAASAVTVSLAVSTAQNTGGAGTDTLSNIQSLLGSSYNDDLTGNSSANRIDGGVGADNMSGGAGNDTYVVDNVGDTITEAASSGTDTVLSSISLLIGSNVENLTLTGASAINAHGNALDNVLIGNNANNVLIGNDGDDTLTGGGGLDKFRFDTTLNSATNVDHISDFVVGDDRIQLDDDIFTMAGPDGTLDAAAFYIGAAAHDASDRIIYNSANGNLYYDPDGTGAAAQILFAHVAAGLAMTNGEFQIIA